MRHFSLFLCLLSGCTTLDTQLPEISSQQLENEQRFQEKQAFAEMARHQDRLQRLSYKILSANEDICKKTAPDIGAVTHTLKSYNKDLRSAAKRETGASKDPQIIYVRPGSPADRAGIKTGDYLKDAEGNPVAAPSNALSDILGKGGEITVQSSHTSRTEKLSATSQCAYPVSLKMTSAINAYANGKAIVVTAGMMDFAATDDELALIIGHELAHNEMSHVRKAITNFALSLGGTRYTRPFESEADYVGLYYTARAGFNLENIEDIWRRLAKNSARPIVRAKTHPTYPDRYVRLSAARAEIEAKRQTGEPLRPNLKSKK